MSRKKITQESSEPQHHSEAYTSNGKCGFHLRTWWDKDEDYVSFLQRKTL